MKLGVAGIVLEWNKIDAAGARRVREYGFRGLSVFFSRPLETDLEQVKPLKSLLDDAGLEAAQANGWYEALVNPDDALRAEGVRGLGTLCKAGQLLSAKTVYVRPGGLDPRGHWGAHPDNHLPQTFDRLIDSMRKAAAIAQSEGMVLAIEGHVLSVLDTAQRVRDLLDAVGSPALKFNVDAVNFIGTVRGAHNTRPVLKELFDLLGKDTVAAHMKDLSLQNDMVVNIKEVVIGTGSLDQEYYLQLLQQYCPEAYCLIEHLPEEKVPQARTALLKSAEKAGIVLEV